MDDAPPDASPVPLAHGSGATPIVISRQRALLIALVAGVLLLLVVWRAPSVLTILLGGTVVALFLRYPLEVLERVMPRKAALALVLALLVLVIAAAVFLLLPPLLVELGGLVRDLPRMAQQADADLHDAIARLVEAKALPENADAVVRDLQQGMLARATAGIGGALQHVLGTLTGAFGVVIRTFGILFVAVYLLMDAGKLRAASIRRAPAHHRDDVRALWDDLGASLSRYLASLLLVAVVQGAAATTFLWLLGVPYPLLLGTWIAATSTIPYIGTWFGGVPAIAMGALVSPLTALATFALFFASTTVVGNIITPRIQGGAVRVHPVLVLLAVVAAGEIFGILGVFLAVPALAVGRVLYDFFAARLRIAGSEAAPDPAIEA